MKTSEIISLGFSSECLLSDIRNNNFQVSDYCYHIPKKSIKGLSNIRIFASVNPIALGEFKLADEQPVPI